LAASSSAAKGVTESGGLRGGSRPRSIFKESPYEFWLTYLIIAFGRHCRNHRSAIERTHKTPAGVGRGPGWGLHPADTLLNKGKDLFTIARLTNPVPSFSAARSPQPLPPIAAACSECPKRKLETRLPGRRLPTSLNSRRRARRDSLSAQRGGVLSVGNDVAHPEEDDTQHDYDGYEAADKIEMDEWGTAILRPNQLNLLRISNT
jgi:hypothetical protein